MEWNSCINTNNEQIHLNARMPAIIASSRVGSCMINFATIESEHGVFIISITC